jgi:hypothetical protein
MRLARVANDQTQPRERTTIDRMTLKALIEKGADDALLREVMAYVANRVMDLEVEGLTGAAHGKRPPSSSAWGSRGRPCRPMRTPLKRASLMRRLE